MARPPTTPLKITAYLADDIIDTTEIIMLDAVLYYAWFTKNGAKLDDNSSFRFVGLPLRQLPGNRWASSKGIVFGSKMNFYCMGTKDKTRDLLSYMHKAGNVTIEGWCVEDIDGDYSLIHPEYGLMRPVPVMDAFAIKDLINLDDYPREMYGIKPPYWKDQNQRLCYVPLKKAPFPK